MNCQTLTIEEVDSTFFGQGKNQQLKAIAICKNCSVKRECAELVQADTWGVFGGHAYRDGELIR